MEAEDINPVDSTRLAAIYLEEICKGLQSAIQRQCGVDVVIGQSCALTTLPVQQVEIAAVLPLFDVDFSGVVAVCFSRNAFLNLMTSMLKEEIAAIDAEIEDGAGELLNIAFGLMKKSLNETGHKIEKAIPTVVRGTNINIEYLTPGTTTVVPFRIGSERFHVQIGFDDLPQFY